MGLSVSHAWNVASMRAMLVLCAVFLCQGCVRPSGANGKASVVLAPLSSEQIAELVRSLPKWPEIEDAYSPEERNRVIRTAVRLQQQDSLTVEDGMKLFAMESEDSPDCVDEWSKAFVLLRVMFEVPASLPDGFYREIEESGEPPGTGFASTPTTSPEFESASDPVMWTGRDFVLTSRMAGFSGPSYRPDIEYRFFAKHLRYRQLPHSAARAP